MEKRKERERNERILLSATIVLAIVDIFVLVGLIIYLPVKLFSIETINSLLSLSKMKLSFTIIKMITVFTTGIVLIMIICLGEIVEELSDKLEREKNGRRI